MSFVLVFLFACLAVVCGILGVMSILPMWLFWMCLGIFWLAGVVGAMTESVSDIILYRRWRSKAQSAKDRERYGSWIRKEVRTMLVFPWFASLAMVVYLVIGLGCGALASLMDWFEELRTKKTKLVA